MNKIKLGDILAIQHGFAFKSQNYVDDSNYALVTLANISSTNNFQYNKANMTFYGADFPKEYILKENDLIMPLTEQSVGLFGNTAFVPFTNNITFVLNQRVGKVIPKEEKTTKYYLHYLLSCEYVKKQLEYRASGTRQRNISPKDIYDVEVFIPEYNIQKKIGSLLYNIEQKININNKISDELEDMAKTIYNYWFLQFEFPNEEGKPYKSSGGKMIWNEELKREIPEGWEVNKLEEYISVIRGVNYKRDDVLSNKEINYIPLIKSNNIQNGQILFDDIIFVPQKLVNKNQILNKNSVLMTMSSGSKEHMGKTTIIYDSLDYTFGAFCSKIEIIEDMRCFLSIFFRSALFKTLIDNITSGTNINNISNEHLYNIKMTIPNKKVLQKFEDILNPILDKQGIIQKENQELTSLRDFLLPLLMNGQVGFKEDKAEG